MEHICRCANCAGRFKVDAKHVGRRVKCPQCGQITVVAGDSPPLDRPSQTAPPPAEGTHLAPPLGPSPASRPRFQEPPLGDDAATAADYPDLQSLADQRQLEPRQPDPRQSDRSAVERPVAERSGIQRPAAERPVVERGRGERAANDAGERRSRPAPASPPAAARSTPPVETKAMEAPAPAAPKIQIDLGPSQPGASPTARPLKTPAKRTNPLLWVVVAGSVGLLAVLGAIFGVAWFHAQGGSTAPKGPTELVMNWPEAERKDAALTIDGKRQKVPASGRVAVRLEPGQHTLVLQRRGFDLVEFGFTLKPGESFTYQPTWNQLALGPSAGSPATKPGGSTADQGSPSTGGSSGPVGFSGWLQSLETAERTATQQRKDIFLVFVGSDWAQTSIDMTERIFSTPEFRAFAEPRFVLLVIDLPRTEAGFNQLENSAQNNLLAEKFLIRQLPTVVLLDGRGRPYAIDGPFEESVEKYLQHVNRLASYHSVRNDLFTATTAKNLSDDERLQRAEKAVDWLRERHLMRYYLEELAAWHRMAAAKDAGNASGRLEIFFEADWLVRLADAVVERKREDVENRAADLLNWSRERKFVDPDRAVRLHLAAFQLLAGLRDDTAAAKHVEQASAYVPQDPLLVKELADAKRAVASSNQLSSGTAFVVDARGYLLTNYHVIEGPGRTVVRIPGSQETVAVEVVDSDSERDMALLKVDPAPFGELRPLDLTLDKVKRASSVAVFGFPLGDDIGRDIRITTGVVSALPDQSEERMLLLDCRVNPGNSGGPVFHRDGRVLGMITAKTSGGIGVDSYGMALPAADLAAFLRRKLPEYSPPETAASTVQDWEALDERVTGGKSVLMVLKLRDE